MIDLCSIIHDEGRVVTGEPDLREITFGELFQIYIHINDKVLGLLLRARKHELLTFEGECLFQKFHDHVSIFLLRPITKIREIMKEKQNDIRRSLSPNPRLVNRCLCLMSLCVLSFKCLLHCITHRLVFIFGL